MRLKKYTSAALFFVFIGLAATMLAFKKADGPPKRDMNIVFMGNSITHGAGLADMAKEAPPVEVCAHLKAQPNVGQVDYANLGYNGHTTVDFLPATAKDFPKVEAAVQAFTNKNALLIFSMVLGTNDSAMHGPNGAPVSKEDYLNNLHTIFNQLLTEFPGCKIIIHQPIWYSPNTYNKAMYLQEGLTRLQSYFPQIKAAVKSYAKTYPKQVFMGDTDAFDFFRLHAEENLQHENGQQGVFYLHPNKQGALILGDFWAKAIYRDLLK